MPPRLLSFLRHHSRAVPSHETPPMTPIYRVLIKTHHMTSRKKILVISKAAKQLSCSVVLKTGAPPGIMLAEGEGAEEWLKVVGVSGFVHPEIKRWMKSDRIT